MIEALNKWAEKDQGKAPEEQRKKALAWIEEAKGSVPTELQPGLPASITFDHPRLAAPVETDAHWLEVIVAAAVILILGKRGSGKSALAYRLLELFRYRLPPYVVGAPPQARDL